MHLDSQPGARDEQEGKTSRKTQVFVVSGAFPHQYSIRQLKEGPPSADTSLQR
jgi:hypothetical protein